MGHSDKPDGPPGPQTTSVSEPAPINEPHPVKGGGPMPPPLPESPSFAPGLDLLDGFEVAVTEADRGSDSGSAPLDPGNFNPSAAPDGPNETKARPRPAGDMTLRIDLARPVGLPRYEAPRPPPPLPATKPARPLGPKPATSDLTPLPGGGTASAIRTPVTNPALVPDDDVIFDIDVAESDDDQSALEGAFMDAFSDIDVPISPPVAPLASVSPPPAPKPLTAAPGLSAPLPVGVTTRDLPSPSAASPRPPVSNPPAVRLPTSSPPSVRLPCSVLVVDEDRRAGAQIAARLMEVGYTCRVTDLSGVLPVLAQQSFDVALVDVPPDEMARDNGHRRVSQMAGWTGPIVVTAETVIPDDDRPLPPQVGAVLSKPLLPTELIRTLEAARTEVPAPSISPLPVQSTSPVPSAAVSPSVVALPPVASPNKLPPSPAVPNPAVSAAADLSHPNATLHDLPGGLRVMLSRADGRVIRGAVQRASYGGRLEIELRDTATISGAVEVDVILMDGRRSEVPAAIRTEDPLAILELQLDPGDTVHFGRYLDEARDRSLPPAEPLRVRELAPVEPHAGNLEQMWLSVQDRLDDDAAQQAFIQACLSHQQIEYAIRCYRRLKEENPGDERSARYLNQVGTILGFYALRKEMPSEEEGPQMSMGLKVVLGLFLLLALTFAVLSLFVG